DSSAAAGGARLALPRLDLGHLDRQQMALAEELADVSGGVALEHSLVLFAAGIDGDEVIGPHQSLRVTRSTSSSVVTPAKTLRSPSSRMLGLERRACSSRSCSPAPSWIMVRIVLSTVTSS